MFPIDKGKTPGVAREKNYQSTTWSLNPQAYQNVSNDMVDWAALAQQWIQMKETCPPEDVPPAPPPPPLTRSDFEEQGEAPMEVVDKEEETAFAPASSNQWAPGWNSFRAQNQWRPGWNNWMSPGLVAPPGPGILRGIVPADFRSPPPAIGQQLMAPAVHSASAWPRARFPAAIVTPVGNVVAGKVDSQVSTSASKSDVNFVQADTTTTIDAAKRKNLPAWIREGLEKMEREKQRQAEKEREEQQRREELEKRRQVEEEALKELESMKKDEDDDGAKLPEKSKFESDSDSEADEVFSEGHRKLKGDSARRKSPEAKAEVIKKTLEELMLDVRRTLTEILLEVTNEEIQEIATETIARAQKKKPKPIVVQSSILTTSNIPGKLGLSIYGNSDSEGDSETEEEENSQASGKNDDSDERDSADSDAELQERIKRQVNAFKKTSREIEQQLAEEEEREERKRQENEERERRKASSEVLSKNNGSVERNRDGETEQLDRNSSRSGRSSRPKKQSRFSDPRDTVRGTHLTHVSILGAFRADLVTSIAGNMAESSGSRAITVTASGSKGSSSTSKGSSSSRSRRRSMSSSDDDDEVSSTSSNNSSRKRKHRGRSRSSDRHSRHSRSRRTRSRSRERRSSSSRHSRH
ncbi:arginine/serine-rich protein PNISR [Phlebotomus papatasi]|uniref:arginine/serine-rich protein PNISR n=1 Tax=Phlebotomus papatasi TaxID=29031 RepID=UPI00248356ED|nr:arginine/serine-rich protein PNISR [Phlebotomus papatasi]